MKRVDFNIEKDGFYGAYWKNKNNSKAAIIAMLGDDAKDYMAKCCVSWLHKQGVNVLTMSPNKKDYSHHNYPLEKIEIAINWLKDNGNNKIGIVGASTTGTLALTAASYFKDISLTLALTPSDFIWQGFMQGNKDGCKEWPMEGESLFTYRGKVLPYMPFCYKHPDYWKVIKEESKKQKDMINSKKLFDDSEAKHPIQEEEFIKIENIEGKLVLIGAEDDALWDTAKYINRAKARLLSKSHLSNAEFLVYKHGTHYVFPKSLLKKMLPLFSGLFIRIAFKAAKEYPKECKETRIDIEYKITKIINDWKSN